MDLIVGIGLAVLVVVLWLSIRALPRGNRMTVRRRGFYITQRGGDGSNLVGGNQINVTPDGSPLSKLMTEGGTTFGRNLTFDGTTHYYGPGVVHENVKEMNVRVWGDLTTTFDCSLVRGRVIAITNDIDAAQTGGTLTIDCVSDLKVHYGPGVRLGSQIVNGSAFNF